MITEQAIAAYDSEQFDLAFELLLPLAEQGDAEAQTMLGTLYQLGRGTSADSVAAKRWYETASAQGHCIGSNNLAGMLREEDQQDEAQRYYELARAQGFLHDQSMLQAQYLTLVNHKLPALAKTYSLPIRLNHCFARVILDNLFGRCWYDVLDKSGKPAYKKLTDDQLIHAIAIAEEMLTNPSVVEEMNRNSLRWRSKMT